MKTRFYALTILIFAAVLSRLLPHPWNWTALGASALLAGGRFTKVYQVVLVPMMALLLSDLILGFHETMVFVYGAVLITAFAGYIYSEKLTGWKIGAAAIISSVVFFAITNFGVWLNQGMYPMNGQGLMACYIAGVPFLAPQMLGDLFYAALLFGVWDYAQIRIPQLSKV